MLKHFVLDESGFVISGEILIIATLAFAAAVVGFVGIRDSIALELHDFSESVGAVSQSYNIPGIQKARGNDTYHCRCSGFGYNDNQDHCDCKGISFAAVAGKDGHGNGNSESGSSIP